jgi:stage II sporulation protein D
MYRKLILIFLVNILFAVFAFGQVRIRIFSIQSPESALFSVTGGSYELRTFNGGSIIINRYEAVLITRFNGHLAVKTTHGKGFTCDSLQLLGKTGNDFFSVRINDGTPVRQFYSGDFQCFPDLGTLVMINNSGVESYIAGVVRAEGGIGRNREYIKTQAILARTYMYKYIDKHLSDRYNVCDDIHCQAFNGLSADSLINRAVRETRGQVILAHDNTLIISAFHSNCGGETSPPQDVWLTSQPYLKKVADPYCLSSRNASWKKSLAIKDWISLMKRSGFNGETDNPAVFTFSQRTRQTNYLVGSFSLPLNTIRTELNLRSTFFSVIAEGDSIILKGRGYGHGVGLCQEGAMTMAEEGHTCKQIIGFYYSDVIITDIKNAVILDMQSPNTH